MSVAPARFDEPWPNELRSSNPLHFAGYEPPLPPNESVRLGLVHAPRGDYVLIECDFERSGGTMGVVAGESVVLGFRRATELGLPVGLLVSSGGARLQEGFFALAQMGRTTQALAQHRAAGLRSAAAYRSPTTGGVFASWASGVDVRAVEPGALLAFGGPRVVEAVTGQLPPATSHNAEAAWRDATVDAVVPALEQQDWLERALGLRPSPLANVPTEPLVAPKVTDDNWAALVELRRSEHETSEDWMSRLVDEWVELRAPGPRVRAGVVRISDRNAIVICMGRDRAPSGRPTLPTPADFRLAQRAIALADRLGYPLLTIIDTPGANPSAESETNGLGPQIAATLLAMSALRSPSVALVVGEGGSGGAMALAHADTLLMLRGTVFEVIGAEAGAAVLYRDTARAPELERAMRGSAEELVGFELVDALLEYDADAVREAVVAAFNPARIGNRWRRPEKATLRALRPGPGSAHR